MLSFIPVRMNSKLNLKTIIWIAEMLDFHLHNLKMWVSCSRYGRCLVYSDEVLHSWSCPWNKQVRIIIVATKRPKALKFGWDCEYHVVIGLSHSVSLYDNPTSVFLVLIVRDCKISLETLLSGAHYSRYRSLTVSYVISCLVSIIVVDFEQQELLSFEEVVHCKILSKLWIQIVPNCLSLP